MLGLSTLRAVRAIATKPDADLGVLSETIRLPRRTDITARIEARLREQEELVASLRRTTLNFKSFLPLYLKYALSPDYPADYAYRYMQEAKIGSIELTSMDTHNRGNLARYVANIRTMEQLIHIQEDIATMKVHQALNEAAGEPDIAAEVQGIRIGDCAIITAPAELLVEVGLQLKKVSPHPFTFVAAFSNGYIHYAPPVDHYDKGGYEVMECLLAPEWRQLYDDKALELMRRL